MKNIFKIKKKWYIAGAIATILGTVPFGCTDLDETVYNRINADDFYNKPSDFEAALSGVYFKLLNTIGNTQVEESCTDAAMFPVRGSGGWYNEGKWIAMYTHQFKAIVSQTPMQNVYSNYFSVVSAANGLISTMEERGLSNTYLAEARVLRAYAYLRLMDNYGGVPIVTTADPDLQNPPKRNTRQEVFQFIEKELKESIPLLGTKHDATVFPRINRYSAWGLLAKLYIGAKVYNETAVGQHDGAARWDDCIAICDSVILSNKFQLINYFDLFVPNNDKTGIKEFLFYIDVPRDIIPTKTNLATNWVTWTITDPVKAAYNLKNAWGGISIIPEFYDSFDTINDVRCTQGILAKKQVHTVATARLNEAAGVTLKNKEGRPLFFTKDFSIKSNGLAQNIDTVGFRVWKWKPDPILQGTVPDAGQPIIRYADILLMKAEALINKSGAGAGDKLINDVRKRSILTNYADKTGMTLDDLYKERRYEFFCEMWGRTDQIRLNKWRLSPSAKLDKTLPTVGTEYFLTRNNEAHTELFPIPGKELDANPALVQNEGYK